MTGRIVLVLREPGRFTELLTEAGFRVIPIPVTVTVPVENVDRLKAKVERLDEYDGCFFTSPVSAEIFVKAIEGRDRPYTGKAYALGERAKKVLETGGLSVEFRAESNTARELIDSYPRSEFAGKKFLFVRGERSMATVPELVGMVANVDEIIVYRTLDDRPHENVIGGLRKSILERQIGWVCFFSPAAVDSFLRIFDLSELNGIRTAAIGHTTANRLKAAGLSPNFISSRASTTTFASELIEFIKSID